jgi:hypothetical protein
LQGQRDDPRKQAQTPIQATTGLGDSANDWAHAQVAVDDIYGLTTTSTNHALMNARPNVLISSASANNIVKVDEISKVQGVENVFKQHQPLVGSRTSSLERDTDSEYG